MSEKQQAQGSELSAGLGRAFAAFSMAGENAVDVFRRFGEAAKTLQKDPEYCERMQAAWDERWRRAGLIGKIHWFIRTKKWPPKRCPLC